jgi:hypothetical protein
MLDITAFIDESGHPRDPKTKMFGVSGCYAPAKVWAAVERQWNRLLIESGIDQFHASDCETGGGIFRDWDKKKRLTLYKRFATIVGRNKLTFVSCVIDMQAYRRLAHGFDQKEQNPYLMALMACLKAIQVEADKQGLVESEKIACVVEVQEEYKGMAEAMFGILIKLDILPRFLPAATFARKGAFIPFQAADMTTYEFSKFHLNRIYEPNRMPRKSLLKMVGLRVGRKMGHTKTACYFYDEARLEQLKIGMDEIEKALSRLTPA